ncbi:MAG: ankyrin repeat domain-containing protein [Kofleriaceae bacterium]
MIWAIIVVALVAVVWVVISRSKHRSPHWLAEHGDATALARLLRAHPELASRQIDDGQTPAHNAATAGRADTLKALLDAGSNPDARLRDGATPAWLAASANHAHVIELLATRGADLEDPDEDGVTPLHLAAFFGHRAVVEVLLKAGVQPNFKDAKADTPLDCALAAGHEVIATMLRACGAKPGTEVRMVELSPPRNAGGKHRVPRAIPIKTDHPLMRAAQEEAAARLPELRELARTHPGHAFVKFALGSEHVWAQVTRVGNEDFGIEIAQEPLRPELRGPTARTISDREVEDWMVRTSPSVFEGGFGERVMNQLVLEEYGTSRPLPADTTWIVPTASPR